MLPTNLSENDSKKRDGRLGQIARKFTRLIAPLATYRDVLNVRLNSPRVDLVIGNCATIDWGLYDDLDSQENDARIVAEIININININIENIPSKIFISHDIRPLILAKNHCISTHHISDDWLRDPEPSKYEKEVNKLKAKLKEYEAAEPKIEIDFQLLGDEPKNFYKVKLIDDQKRNKIASAILTSNPKIIQERGFSFSPLDYDNFYDEDREAWETVTLPKFIENYEGKVAKTINQTECLFEIKNVGTKQVDNLLIEVIIINGWINEKFILTFPSGPKAPKPRAFHERSPTLEGMLSKHFQDKHVGRHEFAYAPFPDQDNYFKVTCADFRHGQSWKFAYIFGSSLSLDENPKVIVKVTGTNLTGTITKQFDLDIKQNDVELSEIIDETSFKYLVQLPMQNLLENMSPENFEESFEFES